MVGVRTWEKTEKDGPTWRGLFKVSQVYSFELDLMKSVIVSEGSLFSLCDPGNSRSHTTNGERGDSLEILTLCT